MVAELDGLYQSRTCVGIGRPRKSKEEYLARWLPNFGFMARL